MGKRGRPKGSKNKNKIHSAIDALGVITKHFKAAGVAPEDLAKTYNQGKSFTEMDLLKLFEKHKTELEQTQVVIQRGRTAGEKRPLKESEILQKFAERIAVEVGKSSPASSLALRLSEQVKNKALKF